MEPQELCTTKDYLVEGLEFMRDFSQICRTCLERLDNPLPIQRTSCTLLGSYVQIVDLLESCIFIKVNKEDLLPQNICKKCVSQLIQMHKFKVKSLENETILKKVLEFRIDQKDKIKEELIQITVTEDDPENIIDYNTDIEQQLNTSPGDNVEGLDDKSSLIEVITIKTEESPLKLKHMEKICYPCNMCSLSFTQKGNLKRHMLRHTGERHLCSYCGRRFTELSVLKKHLKVHLQPLLMPQLHIVKSKRKPMVQAKQQPPFKCRGCFHKVSFDTLLEYRQHCKLTHQNRMKNTTCNICRKTIRASYFNIHMRIHNDVKPYKCEICREKFSQSGNFERHMRTHTGERPYLCCKCGETFTQSIQLERHSNLMHSDKQISGDSQKKIATRKIDRKVVICEVCNKKTFGHRMKNHMMFHRGEKPYQCHVCSATFTQQGNMKRHVMTHTGERPFLCPTCGKGFIQSTTLARHLKVHNKPEVDNHTCQACGKYFKHSHHLKDHMITHSGDKPFSCPDCGAKFTRKTKLTIHMRIHSGETPFVCDVCKEGFRDSYSLKRHKRKHH